MWQSFVRIDGSPVYLNMTNARSINPGPNAVDGTSTIVIRFTQDHAVTVKGDVNGIVAANYTLNFYDVGT